MEAVKEACGLCTTESNFSPEDLTPEYELYADDDEYGFEMTPDELPPPTPECYNKYVEAHVLLPRGKDIAKGRVKKHE